MRRLTAWASPVFLFIVTATIALGPASSGALQTSLPDATPVALTTPPKLVGLTTQQAVQWRRATGPR
jgi:hypothetical protein